MYVRSASRDLTLADGVSVGSFNPVSLKRKQFSAEVQAVRCPKWFIIEQVFAKLKHLLRKAAARTVEAVWAAIGQALKAFMPEECAHYFKNAGYAST